MNPEVLVVREHSTVRDLELPDEVVGSLIEAAPRAMSATPTRQGSWTLTTNSHVGTIDVPGLKVLIRPKVDLDNLLAMLDDGIPSDAWGAGTFPYRDRPDLLEALASFFARSLDSLAAAGLHRAYRRTDDRLTAIRGRIDFPSQLRTAALPSPVACTFDEFTLDVAENRYLLGIVERLMRIGSLDAATRSLLRHASSRFEDVEPVMPSRDDIDQLPLTRLNEHYRPTLRLARLFAANGTLSDEVGSHHANTFLVDMNAVFERFVSRRLRRSLQGRLRVLDQTPRHLDVDRKVPIRPDLEFWAEDRVVFVGDAKYKLTEAARAGSDDLFQTLAYCTVLGLGHGVLIYAGTSTMQVDTVTVAGAGQRLTTYPLDVSGDRARLESEVSLLAGWIDEISRGRAAETTVGPGSWNMGPWTGGTSRRTRVRDRIP